MCNTKAKDFYRDAYEEFKEAGHLMGKYLSKVGEKRNYCVDEDESDDELDQLQSQISELVKKVEEYQRDVGFEHSCFIPREHGEEISLMSEIVFRQQHAPLFPSKPE